MTFDSSMASAPVRKPASPPRATPLTMTRASTGLNCGRAENAARPATHRAESTASSTSSRAVGPRRSNSRANGSMTSSSTSSEMNRYFRSPSRYTPQRIVAGTASAITPSETHVRFVRPLRGPASEARPVLRETSSIAPTRRTASPTHSAPCGTAARNGIEILCVSCRNSVTTQPSSPSAPRLRQCGSGLTSGGCSRSFGGAAGGSRRSGGGASVPPQAAISSLHVTACGSRRRAMRFAAVV